MSDDFCIIHGYGHMKSRFADPIPYCEACECEHDWKEIESQCERDVRCRKCGVYGERNERTGEVVSPVS